MIIKIKTIIPGKAKQFIRNYRLPLAASVIFIGIVIFLFVGRLHEHSTLGQVFTVKNAQGQDYAALLSKDKSDEFQKHAVTDDDTTNNSQSSSTAKSVTNSATNTTLSTAPSPTPSTAPVVVTPPVTSNPPAAVFAASITDFKQDQNPSLQCSGGSVGNINLGKCSKVYSFAATVQTVNGPGAVAYNWQYSVSGSSNGSYNAASGSNPTVLHSTVTISCKNPATFTAKFAVTSPTAVQSQTLQITHSCN